MSNPHKEGWRNEYFTEMARDPVCGEALANLMTTVVLGDIPAKTTNIMSSAALIVLLKKDATSMDAIKHQQGAAYAQPQRPIGMGTTIVKVACNGALLLVKDAMGPPLGPSQFAVEVKGGCALLQWAIPMAMEAKPHLVTASLEGKRCLWRNQEGMN
jgi:hypothetical protein